MTKGKRLVIVLVGVLILGLIAAAFGCSGPAATTTPTPTQSPTSTASPSPSTSPTTSPTAAPSPSQAQVIKWKIQSNQIEPHAVGRFQVYSSGYTGAMMLLRDWIKARTNGRLEIEISAPGAIVPVTDMLPAVEKGIIQGALNYGGYYSGVMPEANIEMGLPFAWEEPEEEWDALYNYGLAAEFEKIYAARGVFPILFGLGDVYGMGANFEVPGIDAVKGKKIRALGVYANYVTALGAAAVNVPNAEMYQAIKLGTVDGFISGPSPLEESKWKEVVKYYVMSPHLNTIGGTLHINMAALNALPQDIQVLIKEDFKRVLLDQVQSYYSFERWVVQSTAAQGYTKPVYWSAEDAAKARALGIALWDDIAKLSPRTGQLVDIVKKQAKDMGKIK